nr:glycerol kinase [Tanacetum cinerariifolium]
MVDWTYSGQDPCLDGGITETSSPTWWVGHDLIENLESVKMCISKATDKATVDGYNFHNGLKAIEVTDKRETTIVWSKFEATRSLSSNQVPGMQSSMPFHAQGVGFPHLPPGLPPSSLPMASILQHPSVAPPLPAGGALSGLFSSLVAQEDMGQKLEKESTQDSF